MTVVLAVIAGLLVGVAASLLVRTSFGDREAEPAFVPPQPRGTGDSMPAEAVLQLLPTAAVLLDVDDVVRFANDAAVTMHVVSGARLDVPELAALVRLVRRTGAEQFAETYLDRDEVPRRLMSVRARASEIGGGDVALVVDDLTEARRVEAVRRDFVANVGHEIKTPVGALQLLAEAALDAGDDPVAVQHFVGRMQHEAQRLARLVQDLLDLSRLQGGEPLPDDTAVSLDTVLDEALDRSRLVAEAKSISIVRSGDRGVGVHGVEGQLVTAVANLLDNAVAYSPEGTRVALAVRRTGDVVEIAVTDQGIGIASDEQQRIFERFYRVDPARSRATGGTGLGLAIVKHTVSNHRGDVTVWSTPGAGSTFTIRLGAGPVSQETKRP